MAKPWIGGFLAMRSIYIVARTTHLGQRGVVRRGGEGTVRRYSLFRNPPNPRKALQVVRKRDRGNLPHTRAL